MREIIFLITINLLSITYASSSKLICAFPSLEYKGVVYEKVDLVLWLESRNPFLPHQGPSIRLYSAQEGLFGGINLFITELSDNSILLNYDANNLFGPQEYTGKSFATLSANNQGVMTIGILDVEGNKIAISDCDLEN
jgi:hypothetical protein